MNDLFNVNVMLVWKVFQFY